MLDARWVQRLREILTYDSGWWLTIAGCFTDEEQRQWNSWSSSSNPHDTTNKSRLSMLMKASRDRELLSALAEQREPRFSYPAIDIAMIHQRISALKDLEAEIHQQEPNHIIRRFYREAIASEIDSLQMVLATAECNTEQFRSSCFRLYAPPTPEEMREAFSYIREQLHQGLEQPHTRAISENLRMLLQLRLNLPLDYEIKKHSSVKITSKATHSFRSISAQTAKRFFESILQEAGYQAWRVEIDPNATNVQVNRPRLILPEREFTVDLIRSTLAHALGHVARTIAGEQSQLGLLSLGTAGYDTTEEGYLLFLEGRALAAQGRVYNDEGIKLLTCGIGLACGVLTSPPFTFRQLFQFLEQFASLPRLLKHSDIDPQEAQKGVQSYTANLCYRIFRGVPDLTYAGVCNSKGITYLRGLRKVEHAVETDASVLDRLAVGKVALEDLPALQELGIIATTHSPLHQRASDPALEAYILSFEGK